MLTGSSEGLNVNPLEVVSPRVDTSYRPHEHSIEEDWDRDEAVYRSVPSWARQPMCSCLVPGIRWRVLLLILALFLRYPEGCSLGRS